MKTRITLLAAAAAASFAAAAPQAGAASYAPHRVIVGYPHGSKSQHTRTGESVRAAIARLHRNPHVRYAVPDYIAHASAFVPNDTGVTGTTGTLGGWQALQWNFTGPFGVDAPDAWSEAIAAGAPGGRGVTVAVLDTGVAYENHGFYRRDPDLYVTRWTKPYDFVDHDRHPDDENGHGTHVAGTIAQKTNNELGATGLSYGVTIMPLRVLDSDGSGDASWIAHAIRYAASNGAQVINMSLEFDSSITARQIPDIVSAIKFAHSKGVVVVGAAGNAAETAVAYPARTTHVISVGATTERGCEAEYSNSGSTLDVVAPGGGDDAPLQDNPEDVNNCHPDQHGRDIFQVTFLHERQPRRGFGFPNIYEGTSMACPHVSAIAALIIATKVIGPNPTPEAIEQRIKLTATDLGAPGRDRVYGWGLVNAARAIDPNFMPGQQPPAEPTPPGP